MDKITHARADLIDLCKVDQMEANASKFQVRIANEKSESEVVIDGQTTISEPQVKLHGVHMDNKLNCNFHIDYIIKKAKGN